jgi:hypothetical protein
MLNPYWKTVYDPKDVDLWKKVEATTPPFFDFSFEAINKLLDKYFRTNKGYRLGPTKNWYQRKEILAKTMKELDMAVAYDEEDQVKKWNENQERDESLDARLEREKGMYESRISSRVPEWLKVSQRDVLTIFDAATASKAAETIKTGVKAPIVNVHVSTLGGPDRPSILIAVGLDPKEKWANGIFENSQYIRFHLYANGVLESFVNTTTHKFRKTRVKSVEDVVAKINSFIQLVKASEDDYVTKARQAIERGDSIAYDVALNEGQIFDNVKHMRWFIEAVADELSQQGA